MTYAPDDPRYGHLGQHGCRLFIERAQFSPAGTVQRAIAEQMRADLPELARLDVDGDCTCAPGSACVCSVAPAAKNHDRHDSADSLDLRKAGRWIGPARVRELRATDRTERAVLVATMEAAARAAGEGDELTLARIRGASLDTLRSAFAELPDPQTDHDETERTDHMTDDQEARARAKMNRDAHTAWTRPLGSGLVDEVPRAPTREEQVRIDQAERKHDDDRRWLERFNNERDQNTRADVAEDDMEDDEETKAKRRMQADAARRWTKPLDKESEREIEVADYLEGA